MVEYVIIGDTDKYKGCLICLAGTTREEAEEVLDRMLNNPDHNDIRNMEGHTNIRISEVKKENCWWNQGGLD